MTPTERLTDIAADLRRQAATIEEHDEELGASVADHADAIAAYLRRPSITAAAYMAHADVMRDVARAACSGASERSLDVVRYLSHTPIRDLDLTSVMHRSAGSAILIGAMLATLDAVNEASLLAIELLVDQVQAAQSAGQRVSLDSAEYGDTDDDEEAAS